MAKYLMYKESKLINNIVLDENKKDEFEKTLNCKLILQEDNQEEKQAQIEKNKKQILELKQKLFDTDYTIIKITEGVATVEKYADVILQRKAWRDEINRLEGEV
jgi:hypothetical protein